MELSITRFLVLGAGAWGTALAIHLARCGHAVVLWGHDPKTMAALKQQQMNERYLPGILLPANLKLTHDLSEAFALQEGFFSVLIAVPSSAFNEITKKIQPLLKQTTPVIWATKGLSEEATWLHRICQQNLGMRSLAVLSGPSFAKEVALGLPTAVVIATESPSFGKALLQAFHYDRFRVYLSTDLVGVQLGGVVKNVLAIAVGMSDGLALGANARAALMTRGLAELCRLGEKVGAESATIMGLSGVGDLILTCTDNQSRNRRFGFALGQGSSLKEAESAIGQVIEGKKNAAQLKRLAQKYGVELPICAQVYQVLYESVTPVEAMMNLLNRPPKNEGL